MIKIGYDGGFAAAQRELHTRATKAQLLDAVVVTSREVQRDVKIQMPKDTGRAAGSWGHSTSNKVLPGDSVWLVTDGGLTIEQGSNVHYIPRLNEGYSRKAPAGFLDAIAHGALQKLINNVMQALRF